MALYGGEAGVEVVGDRFMFTFILNFFTILFIWVVSFPIGVYSAVYQYSPGDYNAPFSDLSAGS